MIMIYISSPYTIGDQAVNVKKSIDAGNLLIDSGVTPIMPLLTHYVHIIKPRTYEEWMLIDIEMLSRCDGLWRLPGLSNGADREVAYAKQNNIPVFMSLEEILKFDFSKD